MNENYNINNSDTVLEQVYSVLEQVQLEKFWPKIRDDLQINRLSHFNYVKSRDLEAIGISKPAARRLLDHVKKIQQEKSKNQQHNVIINNNYESTVS